jgi:hypothetical protein
LSKRRFKTLILISLLGLIALTGLTWANYCFASRNPGGYDFLARWGGARFLFTEGLSPYSETVALKIQTLYYDRVANPNDDQVLFAYPLYSLVFFGPFALAKDFVMARALWMTTLEVCVLMMAVLCLRLTRWNPGVVLLSFYFIFALLWYNSIRAIINGNIVAIVALLIPAALLAIRLGQDGLAGVLLALTMVKPQISILLVIFVVWWALWDHRWRLVGWMVGALICLILMGMVIIPDWLLQNLREMQRYTGYSPPTTVGAAFALWWPSVGRQLGWVLTILLSVIVLGEWWLTHRKDYRWFLWTACLTLVASQWIGITTDPGNFLILFLPLILVYAVWEEQFRHRRRWVIWITMIALFIGLWVLFLSTLEYTTQPMQSPVMFFPIPIFLFIGLYWVRKWATQPSI